MTSFVVVHSPCPNEGPRLIKYNLVNSGIFTGFLKLYEDYMNSPRQDFL